MENNQLVLASDYIRDNIHRIYEFDSYEPGVGNFILHHPKEAEEAELLSGFFMCPVVSIFRINGIEYVKEGDASYEDEPDKIGYFILTY